jgi:hypothetical protein
MLNNIGISTVCFEKIEESLRTELNNKFDFFDIPLKQAIYFDKEILSVQSLIDYNLFPTASLVKDVKSFNVLINYFKVISRNLSQINVQSVILGSPFIRKKTTISVEELSDRINIIRRVFSDQNIKLYMEALPKEFSDVINSHQDLIDFNIGVPYGIHVDIATAISCKEELSFFKDNINCVERFHFSVPGYGYNFEDYKLSVELLNLFLSKKIKGTIEIQNFTNFETNSFLNKIYAFTNTK